jgi:ferredoxin
MRIRIDCERCTGDALCVGHAPLVFALNDDNKAEVVNPEGADEPTIREAAEDCPSAAIILVDDNGNQTFP